MAKNKASLEYSLLDLLTNSFAAAMLLMAIVATTMGQIGGDVDRNDVVEPGDKNIVTVLLTKKKKEKPDPPIVTVQLRLIGPNSSKAKLKVEGAAASEKQISIGQGAFDQDHWMCVRKGALEEEWVMGWSKQRFTSADSIHLTITLGSAAIFSSVIPGKTEQPLLQVAEPAKTHNDFIVQGIQANLY